MIQNVTPPGARIRGIDAARGFTVALMILVNNGHGSAWPLLRHAVWNGLTLSDLVFPFFLFIMGCSMWLSMSRRGFRRSSATVGHILRRTMILFCIGIAVNWLDRAAGGVFALGTLRFWGVMQRIAICYLTVSVLALTPVRRYFPWLIVILLTAYAAILHFGNGYAQDSAVNFLSTADRRILGEPHLYHKSAVDPEGLVSTISAVASVLCGFVYGRYAVSEGDNFQKIYRSTALGLTITALGLIVALWLPLNKRVWSPSFVLVTSGLCSMLVAAAIYVTDAVRSKTAAFLSKPFLIFGSNALALYIFSELLAIGAGAVEADNILYNFYASFIPWPPFASLCYAVTFTCICFIPGLILYRRRLFIKL